MVELVGGVPKYVNMKLPDTKEKISGKDWFLNRTDLEKAFNNKTRGIIVNNPHNPTGKVFTLEELQFIANLVKKFDVYVVADEVFGWTVYGSEKFVNFASLPGMLDRTVTVGSASKSLVLSGWRIGWAYGPEHLISEISTVHTTMLICAPAMQQDAVAHVLENELKNLGTPNSFFYNNTRNLQTKRDMITNAFEEAGMIPYFPDSGDCLVVKLPVLKDFSFDFPKNISQYIWFTNVTGVLGFPMNYFYGPEHSELGKDNMRFCFQKSLPTLQSAAEGLQVLRNFFL
ncbi:kynurenine--oxoglutarate transaminase 3-like [Copidosoma floridanum]|uniref:kynurenine--oxoglutarate transaminase 3-like n=1 Tax=Copidosoma floridanum TaxID=29053 RepID=UPI0006C97398|nr:kynurenine--oxoglutarate transaminase 3-like [Copidosoma floridanum]